MRGFPSTTRKMDSLFSYYSVCPHCGKELKKITIDVMGTKHTVGCWASCGCAKAIEEDGKPDDGMRAYITAGIPSKYLMAECHLNGNDFAVANGKSLYIVGPNGSGKTYYASCLSRKLVDKKFKVMFINATALINAIKESYSNANDTLERAYGVDILVVDDLGKESPTENTLMTLYMLVDARYNAGRPMVVTSNFTRGELLRRWSEADLPTAESIISRLCENSNVVTLDGNDKRLS